MSPSASATQLPSAMLMICPSWCCMGPRKHEARAGEKIASDALLIKLQHLPAVTRGYCFQARLQSYARRAGDQALLAVARRDATWSNSN